MKHTYNYLGTLLLFIGLISCELTDIDEIQPKFQISTELVFSDSESAEQALVGVYNLTLLNYGAWLWNATDHGQMGIELVSPFGDSPFSTNLLNSEIATLNHYSDPFQAINAINYIIAGVPTIDNDLFEGNRKAEILGEAHLLRAFSYFNLLRSYGQFWDKNSSYGMVIHTNPNAAIVAKPRSTVQETYDLILSDLDFAIENAPTFNTAVYASKEAAKAIKARVLSYYGGNDAYVEAAALCKEVINSGYFSWEASYEDIFKNTFNSNEAILVNHWDGTENSNGNVKPLLLPFLVKASPIYMDLMPLNDPRREIIMTSQGTITKYASLNDPDAPSGHSGTFYMRLAEVYLIQAECLVRSGAPLSEAQLALDVVRARVGLPGTAASDANQLLADIRTEKLLDLAFEDAQPWFDMVRYHVLGDIDISTIKPTIDVATNGVSQFILPIPPKSLKLSKGLVVQNPGYPVEN
ncbi:RagB/SusD domain-containing protein [Tenacibaculum adriaticum]|uniref:RagB/SusD domain-containing protein n=1 Tax=Tenacibaculum adriaticum TaxID=413713 RepID=A0A5S5DW72_9FLAO|nr:RagB/SusD family nutrient uptake outer membrane protein [Tenacibaculum adriaticum]TYQ00198.1 RagB/SusD domain-containing protein [Tenacibaculum adriaticum]